MIRERGKWSDRNIPDIKTISSYSSALVAFISSIFNRIYLTSVMPFATES